MAKSRTPTVANTFRTGDTVTYKIIGHGQMTYERDTVIVQDGAALYTQSFRDEAMMWNGTTFVHQIGRLRCEIIPNDDEAARAFLKEEI